MIESIESLEEKLKQAKANSEPVIVETIKDTEDEVVYLNKTSGTQRVDLKGGSPVQYEDRAVPKPDVHYFDKPLGPAVGKVTKTTETDRTIELTSGTVRQDHR